MGQQHLKGLFEFAIGMMLTNVAQFGQIVTKLSRPDTLSLPVKKPSRIRSYIQPYNTLCLFYILHIFAM